MKKQTKPVANGKAAAKSNGKKKVESSSDSSSSSSGDSSSSSDESSDSESEKKVSKKRKEPTPAVADKKKKAASPSSSESDSDSDSSSSDDSSSSSSASSASSSSSSSEEVASKPAAKKQKTSEDTFEVTQKKPEAAAAGAGTRLYIRNLPWTIQDPDVHTFFADCGTVTAIKWIENKETGRFTGSGIIDFETAEEAAAAVAKNGSDLGGRPVGIEYSRASNNSAGGGGDRFGNNNRQDRGNFKRQEASSSFDKKNARAPTPKPDGCRTVFVGNLSFSVDDAKITEFFSDCGDVREIRWIEKDGQFKGCGFIEFNGTEATDGAVAKNGVNFLGRPIRIDFAAGKGQ